MENPMKCLLLVCAPALLGVWATVSAATAAAAETARPGDTNVLAWIRFEDGPETYRDVPYL